jgi:SAM-dependent methyltransferase
MGWIWYIIAALWVVDAMRMRVRLKAIPVLPPSDTPAGEEFAFVAIPDVDVDERTKMSAASFARDRHLDLLDLIPATTPTLLAMGIVQLIDPADYRYNPILPGHTSGHAAVARRDLFARAGIQSPAVCDPVVLARLVKRLKPFAARRAGLAIAPHLRASVADLMVSWPFFSELVGGTSNPMFIARGMMLGILVAGLFVAPAAGAAALFVFHLQPLIVFVGLPLMPRDLIRIVLFRGPIEVWQWIQTLRSRLAVRPTGADPVEARRPMYEEMLKDGTAAFFEPRRATSPLCDSPQLRERLRTVDLVQRKPGEFVLDQCVSCGHIFQNPRLSTAGIRFYYCDFYDGLRTPVAETLMRSPRWMYLDRARAIGNLAKPSKWLDVGTAHAHFCCAARDAWPETDFDGLDIGVGVEEAQRAGWIGRAYRGFLPQIADTIAGQYDVVSLFHCLEHTPDPRAEIAAAYKTLGAGGLLVIEVPDPESPAGRLFGRFWFPWFQPQHLHLLSVANLDKLLREAGFEPVIVQRGEAHIQIDFFATLLVFYAWLAPKPDAPWLPPSRRVARLKHRLVWTLGFPLVPVAILLDMITGPLVRRLGWSNAYRVVARRDAHTLVLRGEAMQDMTATGLAWTQPHPHPSAATNVRHCL